MKRQVGTLTNDSRENEFSLETLDRNCSWKKMIMAHATHEQSRSLVLEVFETLLSKRNYEVAVRH
jgi:hypothetical protein